MATAGPAIALSLVLSACATSGAGGAACRGGERAAVHDTLYFGTGIPDGGVVTTQQWTQFLASVINPPFPQGLTLPEVSGHWQGADGTIVREATHVLQLVHPDDADSEAHVVAIAQAYKTQFRQEAVLRVSSRVCISL